MLDNKDLLVPFLEDNGCINFSEYVAFALYHPKTGYYMQADGPFGRDFVTAPMLSPLLASAIVNWLAEKGIDRVLELGPGNGQLATQILSLSPALTFYGLLDRNPREIEDSRANVVTSAEGFTGAILANEVLDALPFRRFCWDGDVLREFMVTLQNNTPTLVMEETLSLVDIDPSLPEVAKSWSCPYVFEYCDYGPFFASLAGAGPILLIDYGYEDSYFNPDRSSGTMMCYQNHQSVPFSLRETGKMDITAAVNWPRVIQAAEDHGYQLENLGPQSDFLLAFRGGARLDRNARVLLDHHEMGNFVKVASFTLATS